MSWNSSIQFAKLYKAFLTLSTTALTNPMVANLNMATYSINNVNTISAVSGNTLSLSADASQGITVNTKLLIPNHPLVITNNTVNDSLQVYDTTPDTTIFRVDHNGNVAVKADPSTTLTNAFTVNGQSSFVGEITCSGLTCGLGGFSSSLTAPTRSSGDNTTHVATTAFVQSAIGTPSLRILIPNSPVSPSSTTLSASQMKNLFICSSFISQASARIQVPRASDLVAYYGDDTYFEWYIGDLNISQRDPNDPNVSIVVNTTLPDNPFSYWSTNYTTIGAPSNLTTKNFLGLSSSYPTDSAMLFNALYKVTTTLSRGRAYYFFDYKGLA